jgi:hypothetical protein
MNRHRDATIMPSEQEDNDDLDKAFQQFGKRLKKKKSESEPHKDVELRTRLEDVDGQAPSKTPLFSDADSRLQQLKAEFHIEVHSPQTLHEQIVHLLAQERGSGTQDATVTAADLYSRIHETERYNQLSSKEFQKALKQLEKDKVVQVSEIKGTLLIRMRDEFLSEDAATILDIAARKGGKVSLEQIMLTTQWSQARVTIALNSLMAKKMVTQKKSFVGGTRFQVSEED